MQRFCKPKANSFVAACADDWKRRPKAIPDDRRKNWMPWRAFHLKCTTAFQALACQILRSACTDTHTLPRTLTQALQGYINALQRLNATYNLIMVVCYGRGMLRIN
eukprot:scaffold223920_cov15-Tisochrysis_lutea.AAC.1